MRRILLLLFISVVSCNKNDLDQKLNVNDQNSLSIDITIASLAAKNFSKTEMFNSRSDIKDNQIRKSELLQEKEIQSILPHVDENGNTSFYVVNFEGGGFVIISSTKASIPILAYDNVNSFRLDNQNDNIESWITFAETQMNDIISNQLNSTDELLYEWNMLLGAPPGTDPGEGGGVLPQPTNDCESTTESVLPLLTTRWSQFYPFNKYMPELICEDNLSITLYKGHAHAGCVPVAVAMIFNYFQHPSNYLWEYMADEYGNDFNAKLISDIWDKIPNPYNEIDYKSIDCENGTIVQVNPLVFKELFSSFNYKAVTYSAYNENYIIQNLKNAKPVLMGGEDLINKSGHAWIVDGFKRIKQCMYDTYGNYTSTYYGNVYFHMNWGYGQYKYDGYYIYGNFTSDGGKTVYNENLKILYNIIK